MYGIDENDSGGRPDRLSPKGRDTPIYEKAIDFIRRHKDKPFYVNIWGFTTACARSIGTQFSGEVQGCESKARRFFRVYAAGVRR